MCRLGAVGSKPAYTVAGPDLLSSSLTSSGSLSRGKTVSSRPRSASSLTTFLPARLRQDRRQVEEGWTRRPHRPSILLSALEITIDIALGHNN